MVSSVSLFPYFTTALCLLLFPCNQWVQPFLLIHNWYPPRAAGSEQCLTWTLYKWCHWAYFAHLPIHFLASPTSDCLFVCLGFFFTPMSTDSMPETWPLSLNLKLMVYWIMNKTPKWLQPSPWNIRTASKWSFLIGQKSTRFSHLPRQTSQKEDNPHHSHCRRLTHTILSSINIGEGLSSWLVTNSLGRPTRLSPMLIKKYPVTARHKITF